MDPGSTPGASTKRTLQQKRGPGMDTTELTILIDDLRIAASKDSQVREILEAAADILEEHFTYIEDPEAYTLDMGYTE